MWGSRAERGNAPQGIITIISWRVIIMAIKVGIYGF